jgi:hypothetical protein
MLTNSRRLVILIILVQTNVLASITPGGYNGYSYTPVAISINEGEIGYAVRTGFAERDASHSIAVRPLSFMELGLGIGKNITPAAKIIFPLYEELGQVAALGFSGKRWYFTGALQNISEKNAYNFTIAGIYDINLHSPVGSIAGEIDLGYAALSVENFWYQNRYGAAATFALRPLFAFGFQSFLETSVGTAWHSPEYAENFYGYVAIQINAPLLQKEKEEPILYIDINPAFDHSVSFARENYQLRAALEVDIALAAIFDFYLVGALYPSLKTENIDRLPQRDLLDRYYLLWASEKVPVWAACGMLNADIYGCQTQAAKKLYNENYPLALTLGYTKGDQSGINAIGQIPLHSQPPGIFSNSLLFAEGGLFLGEKLAAQLNFRQGTEKKHLQIGGGLDFERKSIFGELSFQWDFSLSKQIGGMAVRLAPNLSHRENSHFYVFDYDVSIYQEGNNNKRLHNFPWKK